MDFKSMIKSAVVFKQPKSTIETMTKMLIEIEYVKAMIDACSNHKDRVKFKRQLDELYSSLPISDMIEFVSETGRIKSKDVNPLWEGF